MAANSESTNDVVPMSLSVNNLKQEMSPLPDQAMYVQPNAKKRKYQMSPVMKNVCNDVVPHMLLDGQTHTHQLDETMYGGTLTIQDEEVSYGKLVFGKPDVFIAPLPDLFPLSGCDGKSNIYQSANILKRSFPFLNKVRRMRNIDKLVVGTTDISQLQKDVARDSKGIKVHLNVTYNDVKENEEPNRQSAIAPNEDPPLKSGNEQDIQKVDESLQEQPDDTKDSLFSGKEAVPESDYFGSDNERDVESGMGSPVFTVKQQLPCIPEEAEDESVGDTSNEVIAPTQINEKSNPITTVGLVEVQNLSSPIIPSGQVPREENTVTAEEGNESDSFQEDGQNMIFSENDATLNTSKDEDEIMKNEDLPQEDSIIHEDDAVPDCLNSSGTDSNVLNNPSASSLLHEHDEHVDDGDTISGDVPEMEHGNENVIYNQEVIKLNKDLNLERDIGSDCVIQAKGQSKVVVSVQSDLQKMKLVQKLFREAAAFKGWSLELTRIPLVQLERCDVEVITEKNYTQYVGTIDENLDVYLQGGEGSDPYIGDSQVPNQSPNATLNQPIPENDGPSLENLSQIPPASAAIKPKRTPSKLQLTKKQKGTDHDDIPPSPSQPKKPKKEPGMKPPTVKKEKSAGKKSEKLKDVPMEVKPSTSGIVKQTKQTKKSAKAKKSAVGNDDSGELLLESLMRSEQKENEDKSGDEFSMLLFCNFNFLK